MHIWTNADFDGTRGWFRCERCGCSIHIPQHTDTMTPPSPDLKVDYPAKTCNEMIAAEVTEFIASIRRRLNKAGMHRPFMKPSEMVKNAITKRLAEEQW